MISRTIFFLLLSFNLMDISFGQTSFRTDVKLPQDSLISPPSSSTASSVEDLELIRYFDFLNGVRPLDKNTCPSGESCYGCEYCSDGTLCADCKPNPNVRIVPDFQDEKAHVGKCQYTVLNPDT